MTTQQQQNGLNCLNNVRSLFKQINQERQQRQEFESADQTQSDLQRMLDICRNNVKSPLGV